MTETLAEKTCTPCRGGVPPLGRDEALRFQAQAPDWELRAEAHEFLRQHRGGEPVADRDCQCDPRGRSPIAEASVSGQPRE